MRNQQLPLSYEEERFWFINQLLIENNVNNLQAIISLKGVLKVEALTNAINQIIVEQESLRTIFYDTNGKAAKKIVKPSFIDVPIVDLKQFSPIEQNQRVKALLLKDGSIPFDLNKGHLYRLVLVRINKSEHLLLMTVQHIICDVRSIKILIKKLSTKYADIIKKEQPSIMEGSTQDIKQALQYQKNAFRQEDLDYWLKQLYAPLQYLELPTDTPHLADRTFKGECRILSVARELTSKLKKISHQHKVPLAVTMLTIFKILLYRYTQQKDIIIGTSFINPIKRGAKNLMGCFVNPVALRNYFQNNDLFEEVLNKIHKVYQEAKTYNSVPFQKVLEMLHLERDPARLPLFSIMYEFHDISMVEYSDSNLNIKLDKIDNEIDNGAAWFDLLLGINDKGDHLICSFRYNRDLFESSIIARLSGHYQALTESVVKNQKKTISELNILTQEERKQLLEDWNPKQSHYSNDLQFHLLFEDQVKRNPENIALTFKDSHLTYFELNQQANQLAHYLRRIGITPEDKIGIYMESSLELAVAVLGVLKAGGCCVPIDPSWPIERVNYVLEDSKTKVLLTLTLPKDQLKLNGIRHIDMQKEKELYAQEKDKNPDNVTHDTNLALVFYTSGSTGKPKGVMAEHRGRCSRLMWEINAFKLKTSDTHLLKASISAGVFVKEFFLPFLTGARLVMAETKRSKDMTYLVELIIKERVTNITVVPTILKLFLNEPKITQCHELKSILCGGEDLAEEVLEDCKTKLNANIFHTFGGSEISTASHFEYSPKSDDTLITVGKPSDVKFYILDSILNPVPIGIPGEICVGGLGIVRGYLNRPELTAEKFIPDPFSDIPGARLYRSGDMALFYPDGNIKFIGRTDNQVKIHGNRVELGEIEMTIGRHPLVKLNAVVMQKDDLGHAHLISFVVPQNDSLTPADLQRYLNKIMPSYMIPRIVFQQSLPMNYIGKVARQALPKIEINHFKSKAPFAPANTAIEKQVTNIWSQLIGIDQIGIFDDFFDLGGNSVLAIQVLSRLRNEIKVELTLPELFELTTISEIAERIDAIQWISGGSDSETKMFQDDREELEI